MLCLYDLGLSRVVKAVVIPGRVRWREIYHVYAMKYVIDMNISNVVLS